MNDADRKPSLRDWRPVHSADVRYDEGRGLILNDGMGFDWHLLRVEAPEYCGGITLRLTAMPLPGGDAELYVNHWGGIDVCRVGRDGRIIDRGITSSITARLSPDGSIDLELTYLNDHPTVSVGTFRGGGRYLGGNMDQFAFSRMEIRPASFEEIAPESVVTLVDVGALGGLQGVWRSHRNHVRPVLFDPSPAAAANLRDSEAHETRNCPKALVIEAALSDKEEERTLHMTRHAGCSSLLLPNRDVLARYAVAPIFEVVGTETVTCTRYDTLWKRGEAPRPDVVKIDTQGTELDVLKGFGELLHGCLGIELEAHFYPIYEGQALIGDIVTFLDGFGFSLRALRQQDNFDGDAVEFNAFFTRRTSTLASDDRIARGKLDLIDRVWGLAVSTSGHALATAAYA